MDKQAFNFVLGKIEEERDKLDWNLTVALTDSEISKARAALTDLDSNVRLCLFALANLGNVDTDLIIDED